MHDDASSKNQVHPLVASLKRLKTELIGSRFQPSMEEAFQEEMAEMRLRRVKHTGWIALFLYVLFSVNDPVMLPDAYHQAWLVRAVTVLICLLCLMGAVKLPTVFMRDFAASAAVIAGGIGLAWIGGLSKHPNAAHYHTGILLVALFGNIALCMRRRNAVISSVAMLVVYAICLSNIDMIPAAVRFNIWTVLFAAVVISLLANFQMDHDRRIAFGARQREVELLKQLATEDALTHLANRRELDARLELEWGRACREGQPLTIVMIDVDQFKSYNDRHGHLAGDRCLQQVAEALKSTARRASDLVARFGGEEFAVLLPNTAPADAAAIAERMRQAILAQNIPHPDSQVAPVVSASFGVFGAVPARTRKVAEWLANADTALYQAKRNGRNQVVVHDALIPASPAILRLS